MSSIVTRDPVGDWEAWEIGIDGVRQVVPLRGAPRESRLAALSPAGDRVVMGNEIDFRVWDMRTGEAVGPSIVSHPNAPGAGPAVQFSQDAERVLLTGGPGFAAVFETSSGRELTRFQPLPKMIIHGGISNPDGTRMITGIRAGEARLWNATTGAPIWPVLYHPDSVKEVFFSRDGRFFGTSTASEVRFWDGRRV